MICATCRHDNPERVKFCRDQLAHRPRVRPPPPRRAHQGPCPARGGTCTSPRTWGRRSSRWIGPARRCRQIERALAGARATGSAKYIAKALALRGEIALAAGDSAQAETDLAAALRIAQGIGYATQIWQCAHALSQALAAQGRRGPTDKVEQAHRVARLAAETIHAVADRLPYPALTTSFLSWSRVRAVHDDVDRLSRA